MSLTLGEISTWRKRLIHHAASLIDALPAGADAAKISFPSTIKLYLILSDLILIHLISSAEPLSGSGRIRLKLL